MAKAGQKIMNPLTGETIVFTKVSKDTKGKYLAYDYYVSKEFIAPKHVHPIATEEFEVIEGELSVCMGKEVKKYFPGDKLKVKPGIAHTGWNSGQGELYVKSKISPALAFEDYYEKIFELANVGKVNKKGMPNLLRVAAMLRKTKDQMYMPKFIMAQKIFINIFGWLGQKLGY